MRAESHGIGLNICKKIAQSLGGDLLLNEDVTDGCEFVASFSLEVVTTKPELKGSPKERKVVNTKFNSKFGKKAKPFDLERLLQRNDLNDIFEIPDHEDMENSGTSSRLSNSQS